MCCCLAAQLLGNGAHAHAYNTPKHMARFRCACVYVCVCVCARVRTHLARVCAIARVHVRVCAHVFLHMCAHAWLQSLVHICVAGLSGLRHISACVFKERILTVLNMAACCAPLCCNGLLLCCPNKLQLSEGSDTILQPLACLDDCACCCCTRALLSSAIGALQRATRRIPSCTLPPAGHGSLYQQL